MGFSAGDVFNILIEALEDIWLGWQDQLDVYKPK